MPYALHSCSFHAAPMPSSSLPLDTMSSVAAMFASTAGCRYTIPVTMHPTRRRVVAWASAVMVIQPSMHGPFVSLKIG